MSSALHTASNYHAWTFAWISEYLGERILDIGGGTGNHLQHIEAPSLVSIDLDAGVLAELRQRFADRQGWRFLKADISDPSTLEELRRGVFDTVVSCNVFEHIPNDWLAFRNAADLLAPSGRLVLVLPALELLYGNMDRMAGHFRRYDRDRVKARLAVAGLQAEELRYVNLIGALGWFVNNRLARHEDLSSSSINNQITLFDRVIPLIRRFEERFDAPFGQSLVVVARKAPR